jgi:hypothetical protein
VRFRNVDVQRATAGQDCLHWSVTLATSGEDERPPSPVCTENFVRIDLVTESPVPIGNLIRLASEAESRNVSIL